MCRLCRHVQENTRTRDVVQEKLKAEKSRHTDMGSSLKSITRIGTGLALDFFKSGFLNCFAVSYARTPTPYRHVQSFRGCVFIVPHRHAFARSSARGTFMKEASALFIPLKSPRVVNPRASVPGPVARPVHRAE